jgi:hypothetical protein
VAGFLELAGRPDVVRRAVRVAVIVGTLLILINYGDRVLAGDLGRSDWVKMGLTYLVPYGVSTWSAVQALREAGGPT